LAGAVVYMMTARKMNASATDLLVWLVPSTFVTGTINRLEATVRAARTMTIAMPLQPNRGSRIIQTIPSNKIAEPTAETAVSSDRLFQLRRGMNFPELAEEN